MRGADQAQATASTTSSAAARRPASPTRSGIAKPAAENSARRCISRPRSFLRGQRLRSGERGERKPQEWASKTRAPTAAISAYLQDLPKQGVAMLRQAAHGGPAHTAPSARACVLISPATCPPAPAAGGGSGHVGPVRRPVDEAARRPQQFPPDMKAPPAREQLHPSVDRGATAAPPPRAPVEWDPTANGYVPELLGVSRGDAGSRRGSGRRHRGKTLVSPGGQSPEMEATRTATMSSRSTSR